MKRILIMEDNMSLAFNWRDAFELNGDKVTLCNNGEDAIDHLKQTEFDLVITDIFVANAKGGLHVIGKLMTMQSPPIIAVTGSRGRTGRKGEMNFFLKQATKLGVSATIEKPFPTAELLALARRLCYE